ncbi:MAG: sugar acetyltransferase [bacterium]|nr:sugar acetyltransferase [bacterium]
MSRSKNAGALPRIVLIGGGVHAAVVADCIGASAIARVVGYTDREGHNPSHMRRMGLPYLGTDDRLAALIGEGTISAAVLGMAGLDHRGLRPDLVAALDDVVPVWWTAIHPTATVAESADVGPGTVVFARAVINPLARIGGHAVINTAAVIEHHCEIEDFAVVSPSAALCGGVRVGRGAFIGAGAVVITDLTIGAGSVVGAGAVVVRDVPENVTVVGNPARILQRQAGFDAAEVAVSAS